MLFNVVTTTEREVRWVTRDMGRVFPEEWERFRDGVPPQERAGNLAAAYARLLADSDPAVREQAARQWCAWEDTHPGYEPDPRFEDPVYRMTFARLVTHYWSNAGFLPDGALLRGIPRIANIPAVLVTGSPALMGNAICMGNSSAARVAQPNGPPVR